MPSMSVYIDVSGVSALYYESVEKFKFLSFPYVYAPNLFSNYTTEKDFYKEVFKLFCKQVKAKYSECKIGVSSFLGLDLSSIENVTVFPLLSILEKPEGYFPILVNKDAVVAGGWYLSQLSLDQIKALFENEDFDYCTNLNVYPQIVSQNIGPRADADNAIISGACGIKSLPSINQPIVFLGSRFMVPQVGEMDYVLILSLLHMEGVYDLYIDRHQAAILVPLLRELGENFEGTVLDNTERVGTLVSSLSEVECLVKTGVGTSQIIDVPADQIAAFPLGSLAETRVVVKSTTLGTIESVIQGGSQKFIFDTRQTRGNMLSNVRTFNQAIKALKDVGVSF